VTDNGPDVAKLCISRMHEARQPVTAQEIARFYRLDVDDVLDALRMLKRKRLARDRRSRGERVWEPWG
jgi:hypothetical protein